MKTCGMQGIGKRLQVVHQGFAAGNDGQSAGMACRFLYNGINGLQGVAAGIPAVFYVAPYTAHIASPQPDKISGFPLMIAFALEGIKSFHDGERDSM